MIRTIIHCIHWISIDFFNDFNELYSLGNRQTIPIPHINNKHNIVIPIFFNIFIHTSLVHFVNY